MRLPLLPILIVLALSLLIDRYIFVQLKRRYVHLKTLQRIHLVTAAFFNLVLLLLICLPKRSGSDSGLDMIMWGLYSYFTVYFPKILTVIFDLLARIPCIWRRKAVKWIDCIGVAAAIVLFVLMWWGALINRFAIEVNEVDVYVEGLPTGFNGYRIAQISDLHVGTFGDDTTFVSHVVDQINSYNVDLVTFTGDIVNRRSSELLPFVAPLSRLKAHDGVFSILGNHDYGDYYRWPSEQAKSDNLRLLKDMQKDMGWMLLNNENRVVRRGNDSIIVIGVENVGDPPFRTYGDLDVAYEELADPNFKILLSHNPAHWCTDIKDSPDKNIALTLSGHTHAMQMELYGLSPAAWRYEAWGGLYGDNDNHKLYVNIGIGEVGIPSRIGATPEITIITLRPSDEY